MRSAALPSQLIFAALTVAVSGITAPKCWASELKIGPATIQKIIQKQLFTNSGRWFLLNNGPCYAFLESPRTQLSQGRLILDAHLSSRLGQAVAGTCLGAGFASGVRLSAQLIGQGSTLTLGDIRIDHVDDGATADLISLIRQATPQALPRAFSVDVLQSVRGSPVPLGGYAVSVNRFSIQGVETTPEAVTVSFDLSLAAP